MQRIIASTIVFLFLTAPGTCLHAEEMRERWGIGARLAYQKFIRDDIKGIEVNFDDNGVVEGNVTYFFNDYVSVEFATGMQKTDIGFADNGTSVHFGEVSQIPLLLTTRLHKPVKEHLYPYGGASVGYFINELTISSQYDAAFAKLYSHGATGEIENSLGYGVNAGFEYFVKPNVAVGIDMKYIWNSTTIKLLDPKLSKPQYDLDLNVYTVGLGLKYYF